MTAAHAVATNGRAAFTAGNATASRPRHRAAPASAAANTSAKSTALVVAASVTWLSVIAILTLV